MQQQQEENNMECDVLVLGSGPSGLAISSLLAASKKLNVIVADKNYDSSFVPNYGVWQDEWQAVVERYQSMGVSLKGGKEGTSLDWIWPVTDCFFGGSFDMDPTERLRLDRPYCRVDRHALQSSLMGTTTTTTSNNNESSNNDKQNNGVTILRENSISEAIAPNIYTPSGSLIHDETGSTMTLSGGTTVRTKLIIDTTGHETRLVLRDARTSVSTLPGFQIAYGCFVRIANQDSSSSNNDFVGPYDKNAMTLFDYRTDHLEDDETMLEEATHTSPTFMYVMPLENDTIFFEETSLVARPGVSFQTCKDRCFKRLKHLNIDVQNVLEEEFCYIPMGGPLPAKDQRVIGLGGAAAMVHPSTGYHLCRMLMGAADMATAILERSNIQDDNKNFDAQKASAAAQHAIWTPEAIAQRNFAVFGGEYLMQQDVEGLRGFFDGFFRLPLEMWAGFLAGWKGLPNNDRHENWLARVWYGIQFLSCLRPIIALRMLRSIILACFDLRGGLVQSVTPFLGLPQGYNLLEEEGEKENDNNYFVRQVLENKGDIAAKQQAKEMIAASRVTMESPVAFEIGTTTKTTTGNEEEEEELSMDESSSTITTSTESTITAAPVGTTATTTTLEEQQEQQ